MKMFHFWYMLVGTNFGMFLLSAVLDRKDLMLLNVFSMFTCLLLAHISQSYNPFLKDEADTDHDDE